MTNGGPEKILDGLKKNSAENEEVGKFLVEIFNDELRGVHFWKKTYTKLLKRYCK